MNSYAIVNGFLVRITPDFGLQRIFTSLQELIQVVTFMHQEGHRGRDHSINSVGDIWYTGRLKPVLQECFQINCMECDMLKIVPAASSCIPIKADIREVLFIDFTVIYDFVLLCAVDHGSRMAKATIVDDQSTKSAKQGMKAFFDAFGIKKQFKKIVCDNGLAFRSEEFRSWVSTQYGAVVEYGPTYYPQNQGLVERWNATVKSDLDVEIRKACIQNLTMSTLQQLIDIVILRYNNQPHTATRTAPRTLYMQEDQNGKLAKEKYDRVVAAAKENEERYMAQKIASRKSTSSSSEPIAVNDFVLISPTRTNAVRKMHTSYPKFCGFGRVMETANRISHIEVLYDVMNATPEHSIRDIGNT